jgi:hypothetical protein
MRRRGWFDGFLALGAAVVRRGDGVRGDHPAERRHDPEAGGGATGFTFSVPRGFGSAAFVGVNVLMGALLV